MIANQNNEMTSEGSSYYPPMTPGFSSTTERSVNAGFSSGLTWPPSPIGDILTYTNSTQRRTWVRMTFSPVQKGFVSFRQSLTQELKSLMQSFNPNRISASRCEYLFN